MGKNKRNYKNIIFSICFILVIFLLGFFGGRLLGKEIAKSSLSYEESIFTTVLDILIFYFA